MTPEAFWLSVDRSGGADACWPWTGPRHIRGGYGRVWFDGRDARANRVAYRLARGTIPAGLHVLHRCDNPPCCNPRHLRVGTAADNARDCARRWRCGKFSAVEIIEMRIQRARGEGVRAIARRYGVHHSAVSRLTRGISYGRLPVAPARRVA